MRDDELTEIVADAVEIVVTIDGFKQLISGIVGQAVNEALAPLQNTVATVLNEQKQQQVVYQQPQYAPPAPQYAPQYPQYQQPPAPQTQVRPQKMVSNLLSKVKARTTPEELANMKLNDLT